MILTSFEISDSNIYFEDSQINKIRRINYLNLDIFIDDLYEVIQVLEMHDLVSIHYSSQSCEAKNHFCISDLRQLEKYVN